jgi:hypothetical protein
MAYVDETSSIDRKWLLDTARAHGVQRLRNSDGSFNGNYRLPPARLAFTHLAEPQRKDPRNPGDQATFSYNTNFVFPHEFDLDFFEVLTARINALGIEKCGDSFPTNKKLFKPMKEQVECLSAKTGIRY